MATDLIAILAGLIGVPLINALKAQLGLQDKQAAMLAVGVSIVLAAIGLFLGGQLNAASFTPENLLTSFGLVLSTATIAFKLLQPSGDNAL